MYLSIGQASVALGCFRLNPEKMGTNDRFGHFRESGRLEVRDAHFV